MRTFCECESNHCGHEQACRRAVSLAQYLVDGHNQTLCPSCASHARQDYCNPRGLEFERLDTDRADTVDLRPSITRRAIYRSVVRGLVGRA